MSFRDWAGAASATLAMVFTDIVGSTELNIELGDEVWERIRADHLGLARSQIAHCEGYELKTIGDSFMVAFRTAAFALDFMLGLYANPGHRRLRIRAGVHVGPVAVLPHDAIGAMVAYTHRVSGCAKGPELWVSDDAKKHIDQRGATEHRGLVWVRHHRLLKGFPGKHRLWSVTA